MKRILLTLCSLVALAAPACAMEGFLKQSTAANVTVLLIDSADHVTGKTGLTLTIYATKAGGTPAAITPTVTELDATNVKGVYKLALTSGHTDTLGELQLHITATGADPTDLKWEVATYLPGEAATLQADQAVNTTKIGGTTQTARDLGASVLLSPGTGTGQISLTSGAVTVGTNNDKTGYTASTVTDKTGYSLSVTPPTAGAIATAVWQDLTSGSDFTANGSIGKLFVTDVDAPISSRSTYAGADTSGTTTLLSRIGSSLTITSGKVDINDKTGFSLAITPPTAGAIATAVWQDLLAGSDFSISLSIGKLLKDDIDATISSRGTSTYAGGDTSGTTALLGRLTSTRAGLLDNLDAPVSTRSTYAGADTAGTTTLLARFTSGRAGNLDFLDAAISSRSTYAGADTAGTTTLLTRVPSTLTITSGKVDVNDKTGFALASTERIKLSATQPDYAPLLASGYTAPPSASTIGAQITSEHGSGSYLRNTEPPTDYQQRSVAVTLPSPAPAGYGGTVDLSAMADAVWDEALSGHAIGGSAGAGLASAGAAGDPWAAVVPGSYAAGTAGSIFGTLAQLNPSHVTVVSPVSIAGNAIVVRAGDTWSLPISGLGNISGVSKLWFSVNRQGAPDAQAKLFIEKTAGLLYLNGAAAPDASKASIAVTNATLGNLTVNVDEAATQMELGSAQWTVKVITSGGTAVTLATGTFSITKFGVEAVQ